MSSTVVAVKPSACFGSGGTRALLGGAAVALAGHVAEIEWSEIGGCSGGSIAAAMLSGGVPPPLLVGLTMKLDFQKILNQKGNRLMVLWSLLMKYRYEITRPTSGVYGSEGLRSFVEKYVPTWPEKFWTVAVAGNSQILFTARGVYRCEADGSCVKLDDQPPSVGLAVCASCAVPGVLDAVPYKGYHLFDGALGADGTCPVGLVERHFRRPRNEIVAVDTGEDDIKKSRMLRFIWRFLCGPTCGPIEGTHPDRAGGLILVEPKPTRYHGLKFALTPDEKWQGFIEGYLAAAREFERAGLVGGVQLHRLMDLTREFEALKALPAGKVGFAERAQGILVQRKLLFA